MVEALFFWALAMYGALAVVWQVVGIMQRRRLQQENPHPMNIVLVVQNAESSIEGVLRNLLDRTVFSLRERTITVIDAWSTDETESICRRLAESRSALNYIRVESEAELQRTLQAECVDRAAVACVYDLRRNGVLGEVLDDVSALCR